MAGDEDLTDDLARRSLEQWQKRAKRWLEELSRRVRERHAAAGRGGVPASSPTSRRAAAGSATCTRSAGPRRRGACSGRATTPPSRRPTTRSSRPGSSSTAARAGPATGCCSRSRTAWPQSLGEPSADALMHTLAAAARTIAWRSDDAWQRIDASLRGPSGWRARRDRPIGPGLVLARRRGAPHRRRRPGGRPEPRCSGRPRRPRPATPASTAARSTAWRPRPARCRRPGPTTCGGRWSTCSSPGTAPSPWSRRSTRWACGCTCSPSGRPSAASRSATPTTASRSTGT